MSTMLSNKHPDALALHELYPGRRVVLNCQGDRKVVKIVRVAFEKNPINPDQVGWRIITQEGDNWSAADAGAIPYTWNTWHDSNRFEEFEPDWVERARLVAEWNKWRAALVEAKETLFRVQEQVEVCDREELKAVVALQRWDEENATA